MEEQLMISLNEAKLMNEEHWIETNKQKKEEEFEETDEEICKIGKKKDYNRVIIVGDNR